MAKKSYRREAGAFTSDLAKAPTGIKGLDQLTGGGFPCGRTTLVVGSPGTGKTLLGIEFAIKGAADLNEPAVILAFEETGEELAANVKSLGHNLARLTAEKKLIVDHVRVERHEIEETGEYDLEGLFIRLNHAIESIGAKRVVLDTIESLFAGLPNAGILRAELRRLFRWLKDKGMTSVITAEAGDGHLTREGLEEYVSDCVILLDHRMEDQISTRRMRILKYRGSSHGTNEYPFLITDAGFSVMPITSMTYAERPASRERVSSGVPRLDDMLGGGGYYRGSTIMISGTAGTGKTSLAAKFVDAGCSRGERCVFLALEESPGQVRRNMRSIGIDLGHWIKNGRLHFFSPQPTDYGLESHLTAIQALVEKFDPKIVVLDPVTNFNKVGAERDVQLMLTRLVSYLKNRGVTAMVTTLTPGGSATELTTVGISSLADTWIFLRDIELDGERNRGLYILKSRGMAHSNQIREFVLTSKGIDLIDVYLGPSGVLTGSARAAREAEDRARSSVMRQEMRRLEAALERKRTEVEAKIAEIGNEYEADRAELEQKLAFAKNGINREELDREAMAVSRKAGGERKKAPTPRRGRVLRRR